MPANLKSYLSQLAIDPDLYSAFVSDPQAAAKKAGLTREDCEVLFSGDQNRIYTALQNTPNGEGKA